MNPNSPGHHDSVDDDIEMIHLSDVEEVRSGHSNAQEADIDLEDEEDEVADADEGNRALLSGNVNTRSFAQPKSASARIWPQIRGIVIEVCSLL